jgi:urease accessory protein
VTTLIGGGTGPAEGSKATTITPGDRYLAVAAAVALPGRGEEVLSAQRIVATVAGTLSPRLQPTVVAAGAHHVATLIAVLTGEAGLAAAEQVLLGRAGEEPGRWTGTTRIERSGVPLLHTTVGLGPGAPARLPPAAPRAYAPSVHLGRSAPVATADDAVRLPLPGEWVATAWEAQPHRVAAALRDPAEPADGRVTA